MSAAVSTSSPPAVRRRSPPRRWIKGIYAVEADIRGRPAAERRAERQERSKPIVRALEPWLRAKLERVSQKSKLAEVIRYAPSRWEGLRLFLEDGRIDIDPNVVELSIRPIALKARLPALLLGVDDCR